MQSSPPYWGEDGEYDPWAHALSAPAAPPQQPPTPPEDMWGPWQANHPPSSVPPNQDDSANFMQQDADDLEQGYDYADHAAEEEEEKGGHRLHRNWDGPLPPPTHWTSTNIDHCYGKGLEVRGVYVVPSLLSDHLLVVTDWVSSAK